MHCTHDTLATYHVSKLISGDVFATARGIIEVVTVVLPSGFVFVVSITVVPSASTRCVVVSIVAIAGAAVVVGISSCTGVGEVVADATNGGGVDCFGSGILKHVIAIIHKRINDIIAVIPPDFKLHPYGQTFDARIRMVNSWNNPEVLKNSLSVRVLQASIRYISEVGIIIAYQ